MRHLAIFDFDDTILRSGSSDDIIYDTFSDILKFLKDHKTDVVILTARYQRVEVVKFFKSLGIQNIEVVAVGQINPIAKSSYVMNRMSKKKYDVVSVYEDKQENIEAIKKVANSLGAKFVGNLVKEDELELLKKFVHLTIDDMSGNEMAPGAGIVVVRKFDEGWKILGLRVGDEYDLPKGKIENNEDPLAAAIRETEEESGISHLSFDWPNASTYIDNITFFIASTEDDPYIRPNPETDILEHDEAVWLSHSQIKANCYKYLIPVVDWAKSIVDI